MGQEIFPVMRGGAGMGQEKSVRGGDEDPILRPRPAPLPSLYQYGHTFILHNELVANYKLICLNCVHLSDNKFVFSSIINIFWHKLLIFLKIVEQR